MDAGLKERLLNEVPALALRFLRAWKRFPHEPSPEWYEENLRRIVRELKSRTGARVALCSLQPVGEDPKSQDPFQKRLNQLVQESALPDPRASPRARLQSVRT